MNKLPLVIGGLALAGGVLIEIFGLLPGGAAPLADPDCDAGVRTVIAFNQGAEYTDDIVGLDGDGSFVRITEDEASWDPSFSPDGSQIAFVRGQGAFSDSLGWESQAIFVMDADGSDQRPLTDSVGYDEAPVWSPDGEWIAFSRDGEGLMVAPASGGDPTLVTESARGSSAIDWSPDSRRVMFAAEDKRGRTGIFVVARAGSDLRAVSRQLDHISDLSWSPDGETVAFGDHNQIYTITFEEPNPRLFTRDAHTPAFSPDGRRLLYFEETESFSRRLVSRALEGGSSRPLEIDRGKIYSFEDDLDWLDCP